MTTAGLIHKSVLIRIRWHGICSNCYFISNWGDAQQSSNMYKQARRILRGSQMCVNGDSSSICSKDYIEEVVKEISNGE